MVNTVCPRASFNMNLLSLLVLAALALSIGATVPENPSDVSTEANKDITDNQPKVDPDDKDSDKKLTKRSYGWSPWGYGGGYSFGWPWYGYEFGHGYYPGWYSGWPYGYRHGYGGYFGYRGSYGHGGWW